MTKQAEREYIEKIGPIGSHHALNKPFSDEVPGTNLTSIGLLMSLLPKPPARLLDLGCGSGWTSTFFALSGYEVVGQDIAENMLELAEENKKRYAANNLSFVLSDYEGLPFREEFDCAVFFDSLHHCDDELLALKSVYQALKPGGVLITHEPGIGHSINPHSIEAMKTFGVNERDMPPSLIIQRGQEVGFRKFHIFSMFHQIQNTFYNPRSSVTPKLWSSRWARWKFIRQRFKAVLNLLKIARDEGSIVMLIK
jgi:ubiquinone/menaquinone biosynthesis C-methylase UbiE